jgi:hypothetical protein
VSRGPCLDKSKNKNILLLKCIINISKNHFSSLLQDFYNKHYSRDFLKCSVKLRNSFYKLSHSDKSSIPGQIFIVSIIRTGNGRGKTHPDIKYDAINQNTSGNHTAYNRLSDVKLKRSV